MVRMQGVSGSEHAFMAVGLPPPGRLACMHALLVAACLPRMQTTDPLLYAACMQVIDQLLYAAMDQTAIMNQLQLAFLALEGCVVCIAGAA